MQSAMPRPTYFRHQSLAYRPEWVDEKFNRKLSMDVKAGEDRKG